MCGGAVMARDDRGSMPMAMLITAVSVGLSAVLASILSATVVSTRSDVQSVRAVHAAEAGLNIGLARILEAGTAIIAPTGCVIAGDTGSGHYRVTLSFYATDPATGTCLLDPAIDRYATLSATGSVDRGGLSRTLTATYAFPLGDIHRPPGGVIRFGDATGPTCLTNTFALATCDQSAPAQLFVYGTDLTLSQVAVSSLIASCVRAGTGALLSMATCDPLDNAQHWTFNGRTFVNVAYLSSCLDATVGTSGSSVQLASGARCPATAGTTQTWSPELKVGAGYAADPLSLEFVGSGEFGRCLAAAVPVAVSPCGQNRLALATSVQWVSAPVLGTPFVTISSGLQCLTAGQAASIPAAVTTKACAGGDLTQRWTYPAVGATWADSFQIQDGYGRCLAPSTTAAGAFATTAEVTTCDGSRQQKWDVEWSAFRSLLTKITQR
jgi:hypothetical protein